MSHSFAVFLEVPVTPDADEARRLLLEETANAIYRVQSNYLADIFTRFFTWLFGLFDPEAGNSSTLWTSIAILAAVGMLILVGFIARPLMQHFSSNRRHSAVVHEDDRTAAELERDAANAAAAGDWSAAVLQQFRSMVRVLDERAFLVESPGLTAREAMLATAEHAPTFRRQLLRVGSLFDGVCYGRVNANAANYQELLELGKMLESQVVVEPGVAQ